MTDWKRVRDEAADEEGAKAYEWASNRKMPESELSYEWGVKAGVRIGWDACIANDPRVNKIGNYPLTTSIKRLR